MGKTFQFECPRCQYRARVSGGADDGINCAIQTIVCLNCRQIYDVFTRLRQRLDAGTQKKVSTEMRTPGMVIPPLLLVENPFREYRPGKRPTSKRTPTRWVDVKLGCPVSAYHRIEPWNDPGHCPRCGTFLEKNGFPYRRWE